MPGIRSSLCLALLSGAFAPLAHAQTADVDRLVISPSVSVLYDSNYIREPEEFDGPTDNIRTTLGLDVIVDQPLGRSRVRASGSIGYDFNSRFDQLDALRVASRASATVPLGARCRVTPAGGYELYQSDIGDLGALQSNRTGYLTYSVNFSCPRPAGFAPRVAYNHAQSKNSSDERRPYDFSLDSIRAGIDYSKPSLGVVSIFGRFEDLNRPNIDEVAPRAGGTRTQEYGISLERAVAPRFRERVGLSYLTTNPDQPAVKGFSGLGYDVDISYLPSPRFEFNARANRTIIGESNFSATYSIVSLLRAGVDWRLSERSSVAASYSRIHRDFRGENPLLTTPRLAETVDIVGASYRYDIHQKFRAELSAGWRHRNSKNDQFDYHAAVVAIAFGARF